MVVCDVSDDIDGVGGWCRGGVVVVVGGVGFFHFILAG